MSGRYYALLAGGPVGIAGLAELYRHDSVSSLPPDSCINASACTTYHVPAHAMLPGAAWLLLLQAWPATH